MGSCAKPCVSQNLSQCNQQTHDDLKWFDERFIERFNVSGTFSRRNCVLKVRFLSRGYFSVTSSAILDLAAHYRLQALHSGDVDWREPAAKIWVVSSVSDVCWTVCFLGLAILSLTMMKMFSLSDTDLCAGSRFVTSHPPCSIEGLAAVFARNRNVSHTHWTD